MKRESLKALDVEIKETEDALDRLLKARDLLSGPVKERKQRKPRNSKKEKQESSETEKKENETSNGDNWPPKQRKRRSKAILNPPLEEVTQSA